VQGGFQHRACHPSIVSHRLQCLVLVVRCCQVHRDRGARDSYSARILNRNLGIDAIRRALELISRQNVRDVHRRRRRLRKHGHAALIHVCGDVIRPCSNQQRATRERHGRAEFVSSQTVGCAKLLTLSPYGSRAAKGVDCPLVERSRGIMEPGADDNRIATYCDRVTKLVVSRAVRSVKSLLFAPGRSSSNKDISRALVCLPREIVPVGTCDDRISANGDRAAKEILRLAVAGS